MFPEYRDLISRLKKEDAHFARLFERHNELDHQVRNMEAGNVPGDSRSIEVLKKEKLRLKDSLYTILRQAQTSA
ncbi:YdcH family protein [Paraburkholderia sp. Tr-20389]|uniref:YdcH family protein n=1 Tax=Paraburkholderia sp. Tr-20389 TaxID=2703903 RepID=UPI00197DD4E5|nr:YdcH family protein [Paraburkholderia sp. Tr-20389]MBN3758067.1 YdcH family protein [Paraburkholderia sp. Tr-20389]